MSSDPAESCAPFGPFSAEVSPTEGAYLTGVLAGLCHALGNGRGPAVEALHRARSGRLDDLAVAFARFNALPALTRRRVLASYAEVLKPERRAA